MGMEVGCGGWMGMQFTGQLISWRTAATMTHFHWWGVRWWPAAGHSQLEQGSSNFRGPC